MRTQDGRVFHRKGALSSVAKSSAKQPSSNDMDELCAVHAKGLHSIFQARPPKRPIWDPLDRERAKRILSLRLHDLEVVARASGIKDKEEDDRLAEQLPQNSISHNNSPQADSVMKQEAAVDAEESVNLRNNPEEADALHKESWRLRIGGLVVPSGFVNGSTKRTETQGWTM